MSTNPLIPDREAEFLLHEVADAASLCNLPAFSEYSMESFEMYLESCRRLSREELYPAYKPMDEEKPKFENGRIKLHPLMHELYPKVVELGVVSASRPFEVGGAQLPQTVSTLACLYLMAANLNVVGIATLSTSAAHLIEAFGDDELKATFLEPMYSGAWAGTMALTESQAGSSLADLTTRATPAQDGSYRLQGSKIFISGANQDVSENVVNMTLARIDGAPPGIKGVSLFAVPNRRLENGELVDNDISVTGSIQKIGWRGLPSLALSYGDRDDCHAYLVGEPHQGVTYMFQMMNEARVTIGTNATATAAVAYQESLAYARERTQGRSRAQNDPSLPQQSIMGHADVRRMLLRQKSIVEGSSSLLVYLARHVDLATYAEDEQDRSRSELLLDTLTPVAKSFPSEFGFESTTLAVQIHGGYGYSSEYLPEAWMRDQKLNSIHEGTTGIQSIDLLGRKVRQAGGAGFKAVLDEIRAGVQMARDADVPLDWCDRLSQEVDRVEVVTGKLIEMGRDDADRMLWHSNDYLTLVSILVIAWRWIEMAALANRGIAAGRDHDFYRGKLGAAQYWIRTELPRVAHLAELCEAAEDSYAEMSPEWF